MVPLDLVQLVKIVNHKSPGLLQSVSRIVSHPVDPLDPCTVVQMEPRDRIQRRPRRSFSSPRYRAHRRIKGP